MLGYICVTLSFLVLPFFICYYLYYYSNVYSELVFIFKKYQIGAFIDALMGIGVIPAIIAINAVLCGMYIKG